MILFWKKGETPGGDFVSLVLEKSITKLLSFSFSLMSYLNTNSFCFCTINLVFSCVKLIIVVGSPTSSVSNPGVRFMSCQAAPLNTNWFQDGIQHGIRARAHFYHLSPDMAIFCHVSPALVGICGGEVLEVPHRLPQILGCGLYNCQATPLNNNWFQDGI